MNKLRYLFLSLFSSMFFLSSILSAEEESNLDWKESGTHKLGLSHSNLVIPEGYVGLIDEDARELDNLFRYRYSPDLEAVVYGDDFNTEVRFSFCGDGYVSLSDWEDVDPELLLQEIIENTEKTNIERKKNGLSQLHVIGWVLEPTLDKHTNTVFWAIEGFDENDENTDNTIINSIALRLGRKGFERIVWITNKDSYTPFGGALDVMLRAHSFDPGYRYNDFSTGDKIASYGVASLVAAAVGGKIVKAGGFLLVFKKLGGVLLAGIGALLLKAKNLFRRKSDG